MDWRPAVHGWEDVFGEGVEWTICVLDCSRAVSVWRDPGGDLHPRVPFLVGGLGWWGGGEVRHGGGPASYQQPSSHSTWIPPQHHLDGRQGPYSLYNLLTLVVEIRNWLKSVKKTNKSKWNFVGLAFSKKGRRWYKKKCILLRPKVRFFLLKYLVGSNHAKISLLILGYTYAIKGIWQENTFR